MTGQRLDLENYVPALLTFVSNKMSSGASATYRQTFGIGVTEWRIMSQLALEPGISAQRICQVIGFDKALVSRTVQVLAQQKYVTIKSDGKDSRRRAIALTRKGLDLHDRVIEVALERERRLLDGIAPQELKTLIKILRHMHRQVEIANAFDPATAKPKAKKKR